MALLGISLIVASAVLFCFRRPQWLVSFLASWRETPKLAPPPATTMSRTTKEQKDLRPRMRPQDQASAALAGAGVAEPPRTDVQSPLDDQTTPKASAATLNDSVPTFTLSALEDDSPPAQATTPSAKPSTSPLPPPPTTASSNLTSPPNLMGPPPKPSTLMAPPPRPPTLSPLPTTNPRPSPLPSRLQPRQPGSSTLAPPPTHSAKPAAKPSSRQVVLTPGHSPLDWARLSASPGADLRNLPGGPSAPYLRVTPSMLRRQTGRRGTDAWTALGGKVYNISPYVPFHPGGEAELLRGAGRDGTRMFGEVHPWVNYEGMLASCLVGILVAEAEAEGKGDMEEMD